MSLSQKQKIELIIFGYVRSNYAQRILDDIVRICLQYYHRIEIIWDVFCDKLAKFVSDDGLEVKLSEKCQKYH